MTSQFAITASQQIRHISEVGRGLSCACFCIVCNEGMIAKKGAEREHHFAHESNKTECVISYESLLHRYAKRVIKEAMGLTVPDEPVQVQRWLAFDHVEEEVTMNDQGIRPDIIGYINGEKILIEVAYSSFADHHKIAKLTKYKLVAIEIDLHDFPPEQFDPATVAHAISHEVERKRWLYSGNPLKGKPRWTVSILGIYVNGFRLPSGDLTIKSVYHPQVVEITGGIARQCNGRWDKRYRNWIVPYLFVEKAEQLLLAKAELSHGGEVISKSAIC
jgi:hypothetical protein